MENRVSSGDLIRSLVRRIQHRAAGAIGIDEHGREQTVVAMHENNTRRAPGYWIQLFLSMGIATLGLVLGSTAVVIGAMLVSPLMGPIIELGMGFAVGASLLVMRAFLRVALSALIVIAGAAMLTLALPFHEVTTEIAARTAPTALDLLVAIFCALTAAYTTVRPGADSTAAAAGTAIGIALVPPLCTIGFGLGTGSLAIAGGAALLFIANFSAILVFAVLSFLLLGFDQVDAVRLEEGFLRGVGGRTDRVATRAHLGLRDLFGSRYGFAMRLMIPTIFLAGVYFPLRRALDEVTWEVRTRDAIRRIVSAESPGAVQNSVAVERHTIAIRLLVVGPAERGAALERTLTTRIADASGVVPSVSVVTVADARQIPGAAGSDGRSAHTLAIQFAELSARVGNALSSSWPEAGGRILGWDMTIDRTAEPRLSVRHLGSPLGLPATSLLSDVLSSKLEARVTVHDKPVSAEPLAMGRRARGAWEDSAVALLAYAAQSDSVVACVQSPAHDSGGDSSDRSLLRRLEATAGARAGRLRVTTRGPWTVQLALGGCASPPSASPK